MSPVFRTLFDASTVKGGPNERGLMADCHELMTRGHVKVSLRSIAFLQTKEFSGWIIIEDL
jgi:hypothetical protein